MTLVAVQREIAFVHKRLDGTWDIEFAAVPSFARRWLRGLSREEAALHLASMGLELEAACGCKEAGGWMWTTRPVK